MSNPIIDQNTITLKPLLNTKSYKPDKTLFIHGETYFAKLYAKSYSGLKAK